MYTVYVYHGCSTCRQALKWLREHGIPHQTKPIRETPPTAAEVETAIRVNGGDLRKVFNTAGTDYRAMGLKDKLSTLGESGAIALLAANGNLVKRPFLIGEGVALNGFKQSVWLSALAG